MKLKFRPLPGKGLKINLKKNIAGVAPEIFKKNIFEQVKNIISHIKDNQKFDAKTDEYITNSQKIDEYCLELGESLIPLVKLMLENEELKKKFADLSLANPLISLSYIIDSILQTLGLTAEDFEVNASALVDVLAVSLLKSKPFRPTGKSGEKRRKGMRERKAKKA